MKIFNIKGRVLRSRISFLQSTLIVNLIFTIMFAIHLTMIEYNLQYPKYPSVRIYKKNLKDIEFPIAFKLCVIELNNNSIRYQKVGYKNEYDFFLGKSMFNENLFGWNGFTKTNTTFGSVEGTKL